MKQADDVLVRSYLYLRRAIGVIGVALPFVLVLGNLTLGGGLLYSISGYYHSDLRDVLVGALCATGVFLFTYRGYDVHDDLVTNIAGVAAIGAALFPATGPAGEDTFIGLVHLVFAGIFFLALAYVSLVLFRRTGGDPTPRKRQRNVVYLACGVAMLVCLALIVLFGVLPEANRTLHATLWLEAGAILAFGVSWATKGEAILADLEPQPATTD